eukprot:181886-Chlamydomonas_euryale.AAC.1
MVLTACMLPTSRPLAATHVPRTRAIRCSCRSSARSSRWCGPRQSLCGQRPKLCALRQRRCEQSPRVAAPRQRRCDPTRCATERCRKSGSSVSRCGRRVAPFHSIATTDAPFHYDN